MTPEQFHEYARAGYNRIPLSREILADFDTPLSTWSKLVDGPYSYLFESVHGGEKFSASVLVTDEVIAEMKELIPLAPLHNPANIMGMEICKELMPGKPNVAVFDTAFHQSIPEYAYLYGVPKKYYEVHGIRKYGFHGTSHKFVAQKAREILDLECVNLITCHVGNGSSITAISENQSLDTSMGFTPMPGVIMGTRCGDIDPGVIGFLQNQLDMNSDEVMHLLNKKSGLSGLAGSSDMRDLHAREREGDADARKAIDKLAYGIASYIGSYMSKLGRVDGIVFTAGLGENAYYLRRRIFEFLPGTKVLLDDDANSANSQRISSPDSSVPVFVIPTDEELQIALETNQILG